MSQTPLSTSQWSPRPSRWLKDQAVLKTSDAQLDWYSWRMSVGLAIASAALLWAGFFPLNQGWLGWLALVPFLFLTQPQRPLRHSLWAGWIGGFAFCLVAYQWIRIASLPMYPVWIGLAAMMSLQFPLFLWIVRRLTGVLHWPLILAAPVTWTALEFFRAIIGIGFPWYFLGHTQHEFIEVIQIADLGGVYLVSFLVMTVNVALFEVVTGKVRRLALSLPMATAAVVLSLGYGIWHGSSASDRTQLGPRLALIQGNLEQDIRNDPNQGESTNDHYLKLAYEAARGKPDLIVSPETALEFWYDRVADGVPPGRLDADWKRGAANAVEFRRKFASEFGTDFLFGLVMRWLTPDGKLKYNAAIHVGADGQEKGWYAKMYCLPFGEYIPFKDMLPFMQWFSPYDFEYSTDAGDRLATFRVKEVPFAVLICYEDTVPHLARQFMRLNEPPAFFLNISNDGWFKGCEEHEQHAVTAKFRCVECRRAMARAVNMGVTCVIDADGRIVALPGGASTLSGAKAFPAVLFAQIPLDTRSSIYVQWGDWLPAGCWLLVLGGMIVVLLRMRREESRAAASASHPS